MAPSPAWPTRPATAAAVAQSPAPPKRPSSSIGAAAHTPVVTSRSASKNQSSACQQRPFSSPGRPSTPSQTPPQPRGARFSREEKQSFGRFSFINAGARSFVHSSHFGTYCAGHGVANSTPSMSGRAGSAPSLGLSSGSGASTAVPDSSAAATPRVIDFGYDLEQVKDVLGGLLPASDVHGSEVEEECSTTLKVAPPPASATQPQPPSDQLTPRHAICDLGEAISPRSDGAAMPSTCKDTDALRHGECGKFQKRVIERFRLRLLERFLSLHDAFSRLNHDVSRDRRLTRKDFSLALQRLGMVDEDSDELFGAIDANSNGYVTLSGWLHALVDVSPKALLWELRCRMLHYDIQKHNLHKVLELIQWPQHGWQSKATRLKRRTARRLCNCIACAKKRAEEMQAEPHECNNPEEAKDLAILEADFEILSEEIKKSKPRPSPFHLTRGDWLKFCTSICLTLLEAERLFEFLADEAHMIDLRGVFETLRSTVTPSVSLERFATKVVARYDTFEKAFATFSEDRETERERMLRWQGFYEMTVALNVNDENASKLWDVLMGSLEAPEEHHRSTSKEATPVVNDAEGDEVAKKIVEDCSEGKSDSRHLGISEAAFVRELSLWAPQTAVEMLAGQICERFGNLAEGRRALSKNQSRAGDLSGKQLSATLRSKGITKCDVDRVLKTVARDNDGRVTLDATINTMRTTRRSGATTTPVESAHSTVRNETQPVWQQLRSVQSDLSRPIIEDYGSDYFARKFSIGEDPTTMTFNTHKFSEAVHGAVKSADSRRLKSVLHNAKRQVEKLEERWATDKATSNKDCATPSKRTVCSPAARRRRRLVGSSSTPCFRQAR